MNMMHREAGALDLPVDDTWQHATAIDDLLERRPERVDMVLHALDLDRDDLAAVARAVGAGDRRAACRALLAYYAAGPHADWLLGMLPAATDRHVQMADDVIERRISVANATGVVPLAQQGAWDWNDRGPKRDREYAFELNRHPYITTLLQAWRRTGNEEYAAAFDRIIRDWVLHTRYPGDEHASTWTWRVLEAGLRMRHWTTAFHGFANADAFTPAGRLLMLSSLIEHGRYIQPHHWQRHNHALMEHDGLNRLGLAFPEFREAEGWHRYALNEMLAEMQHQVYPDGAHDELSSAYHWCSLTSFEQVAHVCRAAGRTVDPAYVQRLEEMYDYWIGLCRPDGALPQNNRSTYMNIRQRALRAAETYQRPDWRYIVTNGREGTPPSGPPSRLAPWAGHLVSRSGWHAGARWSFFDVGPAGHGLVHADALHLGVTAFGKDFLIDSGKFWHERDKWLEFALCSRSHNVILVDGCNQAPQPKKVDRPLAAGDWALADAFDFARGAHDRFTDLPGTATHRRTVVFIHDAGWVVVDRVDSDRARELTALWHFHPARRVACRADASVVTTDEAGANLAVTPVGPVDWSVRLCRGQEEPELQGWYSDKNGDWQPNTCAEFTAEVEPETVFAWVIIPNREGMATPVQNAALDVADERARVTFLAGVDGRPLEVHIPLAQGHPRLVRNPGSEE